MPSNPINTVTHKYVQIQEHLISASLVPFSNILSPISINSEQLRMCIYIREHHFRISRPFFFFFSPLYILGWRHVWISCASHANVSCHTYSSSTLHHTLLHTTTHCNTLPQHVSSAALSRYQRIAPHTATHSNTQQHIATNGNTLHAQPHCGTSHKAGSESRITIDYGVALVSRID